MTKPYPWPKSMMLRRSAAPRVYTLEEDIRCEFKKLEIALEPFVSGGRFTHIVPYMLFSLLEGYDRETAIAAALGFLKHMRAEDKKNKVKRQSLTGLRLPKEPT